MPSSLLHVWWCRDGRVGLWDWHHFNGLLLVLVQECGGVADTAEIDSVEVNAANGGVVHGAVVDTMMAEVGGYC